MSTNFYITVMSDGEVKTSVEKKEEINEKQKEESYVFELDNLKYQNQILAEALKKEREDYKELQYDFIARIAALSLQHGGSIKFDNKIYEFIIKNPAKVEIQVKEVEGQTFYNSSMVEDEENAD